MEWISVEEMLPSDGERILIWGILLRFPTPKEYKVHTATFSSEDKSFSVEGECCCHDACGVTHWMEIPEDPKRRTRKKEGSNGK